MKKETLEELLVETNAKALEERVNSEREWFANQTKLIEENHKLKEALKEISLYKDDFYGNDMAEIAIKALKGLI